MRYLGTLGKKQSSWQDPQEAMNSINIIVCMTGAHQGVDFKVNLRVNGRRVVSDEITGP